MNLGYEPQGLKIYLFGESVDMRKQMNGLIALVEGTYHMDPFEKALFLFTNKKKDKIKALKWDENGFVVYYKLLERGAFRIPNPVSYTHLITGAFDVKHSGSSASTCS